MILFTEMIVLRQKTLKCCQFYQKYLTACHHNFLVVFLVFNNKWDLFKLFTCSVLQNLILHNSFVYYLSTVDRYYKEKSGNIQYRKSLGVFYSMVILGNGYLFIRVI